MTAAERELARAAAAVRAETATRDAQIRRLHANGRSLRFIAEIAGLSHSAIAKIVAR